MKTASMGIYYNRSPREILVDKPEGDWMQLDALLLALGFRKVRNNGGEVIPGRFLFRTGSAREQDQVVEIVRAAGPYLTAGNFEEGCSV